MLRLANAARRSRTSKAGEEKVEPMLVEGPRGTSLRALGNKDDHNVAGEALANVMARQREQRARGGVANFLAASASSRPARTRAAEAEDVALPGERSYALSTGQGALVFGAVYEHCDFTGKPQIISSTNMLPERQFLEDGKSHRDVADLLTRGRGSSRVVWAGLGQASAGVGPAEMNDIRDAIVEQRSKRLQVQKLQSIKPYSAHGY